VPSPSLPDGRADINIVKSAIKNIRGEKIIVIKSTVPPGTTERFAIEYPQHSFLFNPEFLTEKNAWNNMQNPDRQLVGYVKKNKKEAEKILKLLPHAPIKAPSKKLQMSATEAEIVKYASNLFLARKVTFANAIFHLAEFYNANFNHIKTGISADPRINPSHLDVHHHGYRGYGGYCFPKDMNAFIAHLESVKLKKEAELFSADRTFNEHLLKSQGLHSGDVSVHDDEWKNRK
jgi:UDPglucose 6-dehydrogenase